MAKKKKKPFHEPKDAATISVSKRDVARSHICTAVRLYFFEKNIVSAYLLAVSAREILTTLGSKSKIPTLVDQLANSQGMTAKDVISGIHLHAGFLKHANKPEPDLSFSETNFLVALAVACNDYGTLFDMVPLEMQVFETWQYACLVTQISNEGLRTQKILRECLSAFPGIRGKSIEQQRIIGSQVLEKSLASGSFPTGRKIFT